MLRRARLDLSVVVIHNETAVDSRNLIISLHHGSGQTLEVKPSLSELDADHVMYKSVKILG